MSDRALTAPSGDANSPGYVQVSVDPSGNVGIWTREPMTLAHVHSDEPSRPATVHASGKTAALSFTDQRKGLAWDSGVAGERWELRGEQRTARLWTPSTGDVARFEHNGAVTLPGKLACAAVEQTSTRTLKRDVQPLSSAHDAEALLSQLQPVSFRWRRDPSDEQAGFIAEDVPELVAGEGTVSISALVAVLTQVVKEQAKTIETQGESIARHERELGELRALISQPGAAVAVAQPND